MTQLDVLDANQNKLGEFPSTVDFECVNRDTRGGSWALTAPHSEAAELLVSTPGAAVRLSGPDDFAGPLLKWRYDGGVFTCSGVDYLAMLDWRVTDPDPTTPSPPWVAYDVLTGAVTTVIATMVDGRCGAAALPARQFCTVPVPAVAGPTITERLRFRETLGEAVSRLSVSHGMIPAMVLTPTGLEFTVGPRADRLERPVGPEVTPGGGASSSGEVAPTATDIIVGGQGLEAARAFEIRSQPDSRWPFRIETFLNQTQTAIAAELQDAGDDRLVEGASSTFLKMDLDLYALSYRTDFALGDRLPVRIGGAETLVRLSEVRTRVNRTVTQTATIGVPIEDDTISGLIAARKAERVARLGQGE